MRKPRVKQKVRVRRIGARRGKQAKFELSIDGKVIGHLLFPNLEQFEAYQMGASVELADNAQVVIVDPTDAPVVKDYPKSFYPKEFYPKQGAK